MTELWKIITWSGDLVFWFGIPIVLFLLNKYRYFAKLCFGMVANIVLNTFLKYIFLVPREFGFGPAFPSAHTQIAFFAVGFLWKDYPRLSKVLLVLAFLVGLSRVGLGLHSLADVIAGGALGLVFGLLFFKTFKYKLDLREIGRQAVHFLSILFVPLTFLLPQQHVAIIAVVLAGVVVSVGMTEGVFKEFGDLFKRKDENEYADAALFLLVIAAVLFIMPWVIAVSAIIAVALGDSFSALYGKHFGKKKIFYNHKKSWWGSIMGFLFAYVGLYFILGRELGLLTAFVAMLVESSKIRDNVGIVIAVSLLLSMVGVA